MLDYGLDDVRPSNFNSDPSGSSARAGGHPTKAAILLFGRNPQSPLPSAELRCMHLHGTEIARPVPSYQVFKGNLFKQADQAIDFVLSKLNRSVGTRSEGPQAPVRYEIPKEVKL